MHIVANALVAFWGIFFKVSIKTLKSISGSLFSFFLGWKIPISFASTMFSTMSRRSCLLHFFFFLYFGPNICPPMVYFPTFFLDFFHNIFGYGCILLFRFMTNWIIIDLQSNWKIMSRGHAYINYQKNVISTFDLQNNNDNHTFVNSLPYWVIWIEEVGLGL